MNFDKLIQSEKNTVLGYVVLDGHSIGYLFRWFDVLGFTVLASKITLGGQDQRNSPKMLFAWDMTRVKKATQKDFDFFRVSSKRYL